MKRYGRLAQLVEHSLDVRRVSGSIPLSSTKKSLFELLPDGRKGSDKDFLLPQSSFHASGVQTKSICFRNSVLLGFSERLWYHIYEVIDMETKDVIFSLRTKNALSQDELAEKLHVTRQAVSRWETGETLPNTESLKLLSMLFDVSINTLLGSPRKLVCQCCGMPLDDSAISREPDGTFNEEYCKWCYSDGKFT